MRGPRVVGDAGGRAVGLGADAPCRTSCSQLVTNLLMGTKGSPVRRGRSLWAAGPWLASPLDVRRTLDTNTKLLELPINEFEDAALLVGANPSLFPNARGLPKDRARDQHGGGAFGALYERLLGLARGWYGLFGRGMRPVPSGACQSTTALVPPGPSGYCGRRDGAAT